MKTIPGTRVTEPNLKRKLARALARCFTVHPVVRSKNAMTGETRKIRGAAIILKSRRVRRLEQRLSRYAAWRKLALAKR